MNREIKFRAWHNNEMYDVNTLGLNLKGINPGMSFAHKEDQSSLKMRQDCIMFDEETIFMQFTGLKDKNGKEIYEGDIIHMRKREWDEAWTVEYDEFTASFICFNQLNSIRNFDTIDGILLVEVYSTYSFEPEVIGNIYQDSHLIS